VTVTNGVEELVSEWNYDNEGQVLSMTDALNNVTKYEYDAAGNQVAVIDAKGRRTESVYDDKGQLVETIYPDDTPILKTVRNCAFALFLTQRKKAIFEYEKRNSSPCRV